MQIEEIKLSKEEMNQAVQEFLKFRNINVIVTEINTYGYPVKGWKVSLETTELPVTVVAEEPLS
jgi:hypothetical protein